MTELESFQIKGIGSHLSPFFFSFNALLLRKVSPVVHCEDVLGDPPELHDDVVDVVIMDDLKVLYAGLSDPAVEVEDVALGVVVPNRGLVVKLEDSLQALGLVTLDQTVVFGKGL